MAVRPQVDSFVVFEKIPAFLRCVSILLCTWRNVNNRCDFCTREAWRDFSRPLFQFFMSYVKSTQPVGAVCKNWDGSQWSILRKRALKGIKIRLKSPKSKWFRKNWVRQFVSMARFPPSTLPKFGELRLDSLVLALFWYFSKLTGCLDEAHRKLEGF